MTPTPPLARVVLTLPWPPSDNHYFRHAIIKNRPVGEGKRYQETVKTILERSGTPTFFGRACKDCRTVGRAIGKGGTA